MARYKGRTPSQRAEQIAGWVLDEWSADRRIGYNEMSAAVEREFECGHRMAEQAIKVARAKLAARAADPALRDRVVDAYWDRYNSAVSRGDDRTAVRVLDSIVTLFGIAEPEKHYVTGSIDVEIEKISDAELEARAKEARDAYERAKSRERKPAGI